MRKYCLFMVSLLVFLCVVSSLSYGQTNLALNKTYTLSPNSGDGMYVDSGFELTDDVYIVNDGVWNPAVGFNINSPEIVIDLVSVQIVDDIELYFFYKDSGAGILPPSSCEFSSSSDGVNYTSLSTVSTYTNVVGYTQKMVAVFGSANARYIKLNVTSAGQWTFLSEVRVYSLSSPATQLAFVQQPLDTQADVVITPFVTVQLKDSLLNNVLTFGVPVDVSLSSGVGVLSGTLQRLTDSSGLATFSDLSVDEVGIKNITASSSGLSSAVSNSFNITLPATPTPTPVPPTPTPQVPTPTPQVTPEGSVTASFGGVVYGRVLDKFKSPLPEIKVEYTTQGGEYLGKNPVLTDNDGYYYFEDVDTQFGYGLEMTAKRYGTITIERSGGVQDAVIRIPDEIIVRGLSDKFNLTGTVTDLYNAPVNHARVRVKTSGEPKITYTDSLGGFSVSDLFVGTYTVIVKRYGYFPGRVRFCNIDALDSYVTVLLTEK